MPTFDEIQEQYEQLKKEPEKFDLSRIAKNAARGESADSERSRQALLPDDETHYKIAQGLGDMFDTTRRAGAGGTRVGVPGIRPSGGKAASKFLDDFTGTGRMEKKKEFGEDQVKIKEGKKLDITENRIIMYEKCMDCMQPVRRDRCVPAIVPIPPPELMAPQTAAKWAAVGVRPFDVICYLFCQKCAKDAFKKAQELNATGLDLVIAGHTVKAGQRYMKERGRRIEDNVYQYIKRERDNDLTDIFYGATQDR